jgi:hypothetical protein
MKTIYFSIFCVVLLIASLIYPLFAGEEFVKKYFPAKVADLFISVGQSGYSCFLLFFMGPLCLFMMPTIMMGSGLAIGAEAGINAMTKK